MTNDPSKFFMIDGPLAPQGNVETLMLAYAPIPVPDKIRILAKRAAMMILNQDGHLLRGVQYGDYSNLHDCIVTEVTEAIEAALLLKTEEI